MKLPKRSSPKKKWLIIALVAAVILACAAAAFWYVKNHQTADTQTPVRGVNEVSYTPATDQEKQVSEEIKSQTKPNNDPQPTQPTNPALNLTIIRAGKVDQAIQIRTQVDGATSGSCQATLSLTGASTITKTFPIAFEATTASCNGDIPVNEFGASGDWQLSMTATSNNQNSAPVTQKVRVDK